METSSYTLIKIVNSPRRVPSPRVVQANTGKKGTEQNTLRFFLDKCPHERTSPRLDLLQFWNRILVRTYSSALCTHKIAILLKVLSARQGPSCVFAYKSGGTVLKDPLLSGTCDKKINRFGKKKFGTWAIFRELSL